MIPFLHTLLPIVAGAYASVMFLGFTGMLLSPKWKNNV